MKLTNPILARLAVLSVTGLVLHAPAALAGSAAEQVIALEDGWNAVWLEVQPTYPAGHARAGQPMAPADVFPAEVQTVISPKPLAGFAEVFAEDPTNAGSFNQDGWEQWHNPTTVGDNLGFITGNRPYLVEVNGDKNFTLAGKVRFHRPLWIPDRFNLVGFGLDGTPTFQDFFGDSNGTHPVNRIFRLNPANGNWQSVTGTDQMTAGEAYWIFSSGPSDYMGPVSVTFDGSASGTLNFGGPSDAVTVDEGVSAMSLDLEELVFTNLSSTPAVPRLELVTNENANAGNPGDLGLYAVIPDFTSLGYTSVAQLDPVPDDPDSPNLGKTVPAETVGANGAPVYHTSVLSIGANRTWDTNLAGRTNLYRLKPGGGAAFWLPITAIVNGLQFPGESILSGTAGLWVGEINVNAASSIVEELDADDPRNPVGTPRPVSAPAPLRVLLHNDGTNVKFLSQVTFMQTRTADSQGVATPVLVVDRNKLSLFEGIKERNGKRVGVRLEAAAFDMPRDTSIAAQSEDPVTPDSDDIIDMVVNESTDPETKWLDGKGLYTVRGEVTEEAINAYVTFRGARRPPGLKDVYKLTQGMAGTLGAGETLTTTLVMDSFHRSNPFRHAFHPDHTAGPHVTRALVISLDAEQSTPDRLRGTYTETLGGLIKSNLTLSGIITLRRVSSVPTLDEVAAP